MRKLLLALLLLAYPIGVGVRAAAPTNYYAGPAGSDAGANPCTDSGAPCTVVGGIAKLSSGDTLWLQDGTYTGANYMITVTARVFTSLTYIKAVNDGAVSINGQGARRPISIGNSEYVSVWGVNAYASNDTVVTVYDSTNPAEPTHNELHRIIAWDAGDGNYHGISMEYQSDSLVEDCAAFGRSRYNFIDYYGIGNNFRRNWGKWSGITTNDYGPKATFAISYNSTEGIFENNIAQWDYISGDTDEQFGLFAVAQDDTHNRYVELYGNIAVIRTGDIFGGNALFFLTQSGGPCVMDHNAAYIHIEASGKYPFNCSTYLATESTADNNTSITGIGGQASYFEDQWNSTDLYEDDEVGAYNLYTNAGSGATVCKRYENGSLTATNLWPWPMTARINAAGTASGYTVPDIDTLVQGIFGTYPAACGGAATSGGGIIGIIANIDQTLRGKVK